MCFTKLSLPRWSTRKRPTEEPQEADDPPPYSQIESQVDSRIVIGINQFFSELREYPSNCWRLELALFPTAKYRANNANPYDVPAWVARVSVTAMCLPSLMKYGLYVDEDSVLKHKGHFVLDDGSRRVSPDQPPTHMRHYVLAEDHPRWHANVAVLSPLLSELTKFKVHELGPDNVVAAAGFDKCGNRVYSYSAINPEENFNAIYDGKPLRGWWPWPRAPLKEDSVRDRFARRFLKWKDGVEARELRAE